VTALTNYGGVNLTGFEAGWGDANTL